MFVLLCLAQNEALAPHKSHLDCYLFSCFMDDCLSYRVLRRERNDEGILILNLLLAFNNVGFDEKIPSPQAW